MDKKNDVLQSTLKQIEKQFGKGSIMKLGDKEDRDIEASSSGSLALDIALGIGAIQREELLRSMDLNHQVKRHSHCMRLQKFKRQVALQRLLTRNTRLIRNMLVTLVLMLIIFY